MGYTGNYTVKAYKQSNDQVEVASLVVGPMSGTVDAVSGVIVVPTTESYVIRVFGCGTTQVAQFNMNVSGICPLPGTPAVSALTTTTGTFTWAASSPAPAGGYDWQLILVHSFDDTEVVQQGNTSALSLSLTSMLPGTSYIFRVISNCGSLNVSSNEDVSFTTPSAPVPTGQVQVISNLGAYGWVIVRSTTTMINYYCQAPHDLAYDQYEIINYGFDGPGCSGVKTISPAVGTLFTIDATNLLYTINITCT